MKKIEVRTKQNYYNDNYITMDIISREEALKTIENLDTVEINETLFEKALDYAGNSGYIIAELNLEDGCIYYSYCGNNSGSMEPVGQWITIETRDAQFIFDFYNIENVIDCDILEELEEEVKEDKYNNTHDAVWDYIEKNNLDVKELYLETFKLADCYETDEIDKERLKEEINDIYDMFEANCDDDEEL